MEAHLPQPSRSRPHKNRDDECHEAQYREPITVAAFTLTASTMIDPINNADQRASAAKKGRSRRTSKSRNYQATRLAPINPVMTPSRTTLLDPTVFHVDRARGPRHGAVRRAR